VSFLSITIPASLLLAAVLLAIVIRSVRAGDFDDWEGPAARHWLDDDACPEREAESSEHEGEASRDDATDAPPGARPRDG